MFCLNLNTHWLPSRALEAHVPALGRAARPELTPAGSQASRVWVDSSKQGQAGMLEPPRPLIWAPQGWGTWVPWLLLAPVSFARAERHQATALLLSPATCQPRHGSLAVPGAGTQPTRTSHTDSPQLPEPKETTAQILPHFFSVMSLNATKYLKANHQMASIPWQVSCSGTGMCSEADFQFIILQHPGEGKRARPSLNVGQEETTFNSFSPSFHTVLRQSAKQPHCLFFISCLLLNLGLST